MNEHIKNPKILAVTFIFFCLIAIGGLIIINLKQLTPVFENWLLQGNFLQRSRATLSLEGSSLKINFNLVDSDKEKIASFNKKLNTSSGWTEGMRFELDKESAENIKGNLPVEVDLFFSDSGVKFSNQPLTVIVPSFSGQKYEYATGSGRAIFSGDVSSNFYTEVISPEILLTDASKSGKLQYSEKLLPVLPILSKIDRIEVRVQNRKVNGEIKLK